MKQLQGVIIGLLLSSAACAADMPATYEPPAMHTWHGMTADTPAVDWTGLYVGIQGGGGWGNGSWAGTGGSIDLSTSGALGGGHIGYDWRAGNNCVLGLEGELDAAGIAGKVTRSGVAYKSNIKWIATVTGRVGYAVNSALIYAKGGAAFVDEDYSTGASGSCTAGPGVQCAAINAQASATRTGWTIGAGAEWAFAPRWSARLEYNYVDTGSQNVTFSDGSTAKIKQNAHLLKVGLSYSFK